jgi:hypothetical protein
MKRTVPALCFAFALCGVAAFAQYDRPYGDRDYARQDRGVFDRARIDLDRASAYPYASPNDRRRFDDARGKLYEFQIRFDQGRYDKHHLDEAIDRIQHVVESNSLDPRDRGALSDDLRRLKDYRAFRARNPQFNNAYR